MREILFKAKQTDTKEWVEGYPFPSEPGGELNLMTIFEDIPGGLIMAAVEIDPETLCQSTGLTDSMAKKVFDGDILKDLRGMEKDSEFVVRFGNCKISRDAPYQNGYYGFYLEGHDANTKKKIKNDLRDDIVFWLVAESCEVVGNIHDEVTP